MKIRSFLGLLVSTGFLAPAAFADDKAACLDAASRGQRFRDTHQLVEARDQFRICAAAQCPGVVQSDCANWLADVEKALPSVVLIAKNGAGADLTDVKVSVDGQPLVSKLDGQAVTTNAGAHSFHFEGQDGTSIDQQVLIKEGEKNQAVTAVLGAAPAATPPSLPGAAESPRSSGGTSSPWRTAGWVLGGAGVVGLGVGAAFGIVAIGDKNAAHCDASHMCDAGTVVGIKRAALVSDVGWIAGGVLLASGVAFVIFAPRGSHEPTAGVRLAPVVTASGGELVAGGSW
jgi:hypothetical protein